MKFNINLKDARAESSLLVLVLRSGNRKISISTGIKVRPENWDRESQFIKRTDKYSNIGNGLLLDWKRAATDVVMADKEKPMSLDTAKERILVAMGAKAGQADKNMFMPYYEWWSTTSTTKREATRFLKYSFRLFRKFLGRRNPTFDEITLPLIERYIEWMAARGLAPNTRGGHVKRIKAAMRQAYDEGRHSNTEYTRFRKETEKVDNIYLTGDEIRRIEDVPLSGTEAMIRDLFIIGCHTALRYSDCIRLTLQDIDSANMIRIRQQKTDGEVVIPCHPKVREILERYGGAAPFVNIGYVNSGLKDICRKAGITEVVGVKRRGAKEREYYEKWELVSSHTARRSAATNMFKAGIPPISIMKITGHSSERVFLDYIKIDGEENAQLLMLHSFFNS